MVNNISVTVGEITQLTEIACVHAKKLFRYAKLSRLERLYTIYRLTDMKAIYRKANRV